MRSLPESLANITGVKTVMNNLTISAGIQPMPAKPLALPVGTVIPIRLNSEIDTKTAKAGDTFHGSVSANVLSGATVALPLGTVVDGRIVEVKSAGRLAGAAELSLELVSVQLNGQQVAITTHELSSKNNGRGTNTAARTGGGAALGAIIGGLAGGGTGAGIGAASGGVIGLGSNVIRPGQQIVLKPEALLQFQTAAEIVIEHGATPSAPALADRSSASSGAIPISNTHASTARLEIIGLQPGMSYKEAQDIVQRQLPGAHFNALPNKGQKRYSKGEYISSTGVQTPALSLVLTFAEVYPGMGTGDEILTNINYQPHLTALVDKQDFTQRLVQKFGQPVKIFDQQEYYWADRSYDNPLAFDLSDGPVLHLNTYGPALSLADSSIKRRMEAAFNSKGTGNRPPL